MTIEINIIYLIIVTVITNEVVAHLLNWWCRTLDETKTELPFVFVYLFKTTVLIWCLTSLIGGK